MIFFLSEFFFLSDYGLLLAISFLVAPRHASELNEAFENTLTAGPALAKMMFVDETCKL